VLGVIGREEANRAPSPTLLRSDYRRHLRLAALYGILGSDEGPAAQIRADHREVWTVHLTPDVGLAPPRSRGRFVSRQRPGSLLDDVADVALTATSGDSDRARAMSKATWDRARTEQGRLALPSAEAIRKRFGMGWGRVMVLAMAERSHRTSLIGQWDGSHFAGWGAEGPHDAIRVMRTVALRIGHAPTAFEYDEESRVIEARSARRRTGRPLLLPRSVYLLSVHKSWDAALREAGLEPRPRPPAPPPAPSLSRALDQFIDEFGVLPNSGYFLEWCRRMDIPTTRISGGWAAVVTEVRGIRSARGEPTPEHARRTKSLPPLPDPLPRVRRMAFRHSRDAILDSLRLYGRVHLPPGAMPRQKHYMAACRKDRQLIWPGHFARFGRFHDLCLEAGIE